MSPVTGGLAATRDRDASRVPVLGLTVLYDARCSLCAYLRGWLGKQAQLVPLRFVPAGSDEARRRFPELDHQVTLGEITVVGDGGQVFQGPAAWVVILWALREHRPLAHRLSTPAGARLAKGAALAAAKWRAAHSADRWDGSVYQRGDGWRYDPGTGWTYEAVACDSGGCSTDSTR
ncbi:DCC1-like thiol-disulfide oxidoreductase family protein [Streptomyces sp. NPDC048415]|uniref:thiol-disulfide oxidoreductase DCC family protein n=1 Tax=Streptomyces sp. NPDC048415 TaxID=3154822 RepID=UPI0034388FC8